MTNISEPESLRRNSRVVQKSEVDYSVLTGKVIDDDPHALVDMKRIFEGGIRFFLNRSGVPVSDQGALVDKCLSILQDHIKIDPNFDSSSIPKCLLDITRTFTAGSDKSLVKPAQVERATVALTQLSDQGKEAVVSYFGNGQTPNEICQRLGITASKFHQYKSDAKFAFMHASSDVKGAPDSDSGFVV